MEKYNFIPFPSLATEHYSLRQLQQDDDQAIYVLRTDENVNRYLYRKRAESIEDARIFIKKITEALENGESILWAICTPNDPALRGTICLWNVDPDQSKAEIGFELLPAFQGKGILQEVMPIVTSFGFEKMRLAIIEAHFNPENSRSLKSLKKNGFEPAGNSESSDGEIVYELKRPLT